MSALHFHDKERTPPNNTDRFIKLGNFLKNMVARLQEIVIPGEFLCLDETLVGFKGRLGIKQYSPLKRSRFGVLFYMLVDCSTGMLLDVLPYQGKGTNLPKPLVDELKRGGATVYTMLEKHFNKNHKVITDNFFNSPLLAKKLMERNTFLLGTVQKRRKEMPKMKSKMKKGEIKLYSNGNILLERLATKIFYYRFSFFQMAVFWCSSWKDRREVVIINTFMPHQMTFSPARNPANSRAKPESVLLYNKKMGGVDSIDKSVKPFGSHRKTYKWYKKIFFHFVDVAVYNAWQAYKVIHTVGTNKFEAFSDFLIDIIESIMVECQVQRSARGRKPLVRKPETIDYHIPVRKGRSDCVWCKRKEGKPRSQTQYTCSTCKVRLCLQKGDSSCYMEYHQSLKQLKTNRLPLASVENSENDIASFNPLYASTPAQIQPEEMEEELSHSIMINGLFDL